MVVFNSMTERKTPRFRRRFVRVANRPSTALIHEAEVGVKWTWKRGCRASQRFTASGQPALCVDVQADVERVPELVGDQLRIDVEVSH